MNNKQKQSELNLDRRWKKAVDAMHSGDTEGCFYVMTSLAKEGHPQAMVELGVIYETGPSPIDIDLEKAIYWYEMAASKKNLDGVLAIARLHLIGCGYPQNYEIAKLYYESILEEYTDERALFGLAYIYHQGLGVEINLEKAETLYLKALSKGHLIAPKWLANLYWSRGKYFAAIKYYIKSFYRIFKTALTDNKNIKLHRHL